jgi:hypothetical protein
MPRLSFRRPIENTLRKTQAKPHIVVAKRLTDWRRDLDTEEIRKTKRNSTKVGSFNSLPPTYVHCQYPEQKNTREPTFRFYESVPPTYIGPRHPRRSLPEQSIRERAVRPTVYRHTDTKEKLFSLRLDKVPIQVKERPSLEHTIQTLRLDLLQAEQREIQTRGISAPQTRNFSHGANRANMSDDAYSKFLEGANDTGATTQESKSYTTKSVNTKVPKALESVEEYYTSDADEPFEPVSLEYEGRDISAGTPHAPSLPHTCI